MLFLHCLLPQIHLQNLFLLPPTPVLAAPAPAELRPHRADTWNLNVLWDLGRGELLEAVGRLRPRRSCRTRGVHRGSGWLPAGCARWWSGSGTRAAASAGSCAGSAPRPPGIHSAGGQEHEQAQIRELLSSHTVKRCLVTVAEWCSPVTTEQ